MKMIEFKLLESKATKEKTKAISVQKSCHYSMDCPDSSEVLHERETSGVLELEKCPDCPPDDAGELVEGVPAECLVTLLGGVQMP